MLREAKNRAIVAILLSGRHASAWIEHGSAHRCRDECSSFLAIPRKLSLARNWAAKVRAIISGGRIIVRIGRLASTRLLPFRCNVVCDGTPTLHIGGDLLRHFLGRRPR